MRHKKHAPPENHERWVVSYADFVTLLFAFFVLMFASTESDKTKAKEVSKAIEEALDNGTFAPKATWILMGSSGPGRGPKGIVGRTSDGKPANLPESTLDLVASMKMLSSELSDEIRRGAVTLKLEQRGLVIGLTAAAFFPSGDDTIMPSSLATFEKLGKVLNQMPNNLRLEGHTDSVPINNVRFRSNWELSSARSIAMLRLLNEKYGVDARRISIAGYADNDAIDTNETEAGRARNRRVDIVVLSKFGMQGEPPAAKAQTAASAPPQPANLAPQPPKNSNASGLEGRKPALQASGASAPKKN